MHELSIAKGILDVIEDQRKSHNFSRVNSIEILCGDYNCLTEENLRFCFESIATAAFIKEAVLIIKRKSGESGIYLNKLEVS